jgi:hypothetical protein
MCYHKQFDNLSFNEKHLIYQQQGPSNSPANTLVLGQSVQDSLANIINAAARVVNVGAGVLETGAKLLDEGVELTKDGAKMLVEWYKDPGKPTKLSEYDEVRKYFNFGSDPNKSKGPESTGDPDLDRSIKFYLLSAYLLYKSALLAKFLSPAMDEFKKVGAEIEGRRGVRSYVRSQLDSVVDDITKNQSILDSGHLLKTDPEYGIVKTRLQSLRLRKVKLEQKLSMEVQWDNSPQYQTVEFPPKSGKYVQRFGVEKGDACTINLEKYYKFLAFYLRPHDKPLQEYKDEIEKLKYHGALIAMNQFKLLRSKNAKDAEAKLKAYLFAKSQIKQRFNNLKESIKFEPVGSPESIVELETAVLAPTNPSSPGNYEQKRKDFLDKLRKRRNGGTPFFN